MKPKIRIGILGIGAVGGYFGGRLEQKFADSDAVEIVFIAKKEAATIIKEHGLKLLTPNAEQLIYPRIVVSDPDAIGKLDYLLCTVKSYDLDASLLALKQSISDTTVILPLLNGVNAKERISKIYPEAQVLDGCVYIVAKRIAPGTVEVTGALSSLFFGSDYVSPARLNELAGLLEAEGIDSQLSDHIMELLWEKFIFVSPLASLTSYLNLPIGPILESDVHTTTLKQMVTEVSEIAKKRGIVLPNIVDITMNKIGALPYHATTSMHNDFLKKGKTEFESLTEFVIVSGLTLGVATPKYDQIMASYSSWKLHYLV